jgi:hypothetical protein
MEAVSVNRGGNASHNANHVQMVGGAVVHAAQISKVGRTVSGQFKPSGTILGQCSACGDGLRG